jgi:hypothetical protein
MDNEEPLRKLVPRADVEGEKPVAAESFVGGYGRYDPCI